MVCTYKDCEDEAKHVMKSTSGEIWAELCNKHYEEHDSSVDAALKDPCKDNLKKMLGAWVRAQGGAKAAAKRT